jgi:hypothetical protein
MSELVPTLKSFFAIPDKATPDRPGEQWSTFRERIANQFKGIRWPAAMPDLLQKIGGLFDVSLPDLLISTWKKAEDLQRLLDESRKSPQEAMFIELAQHTISTEHHPSIEIRVKNIPLPKRIDFTVLLSLTVKGFVLTIQGGKITELRTGSCEGTGSIAFESLPIAEKQLQPIMFPGVISIPGVISRAVS